MPNCYRSSIFKYDYNEDTSYLTHSIFRWYGKLVPLLVKDILELYTEKGDTVLANFIINSIHPYLLTRYRINNYVYSFGCSLAALNALAVNESDIFKGAILLSPEGDIDKITKLKLSNDKLYYIRVYTFC